MVTEGHGNRKGGRVLAVGGALFAVATFLHPSQETAAAILATEARLVASHAVYIAAYVLILLGLPVLNEGQLQRSGRLGSAGFVVAFVGTALLAISSQFGFLAPVLAAEAPATLGAIEAYGPVVVFNGLAALSFMGGYILLGLAIASAGVFPRWTGLLIAVGAPAHLVGFGVAQLALPALWFVSILGSVALGLGLARAGLAPNVGQGALPPAR